MEERICILIAMYSQGLGVDQDKGEAVKWYKLAAEQGYTKAQSNLGAIYEQPILSPHPQNPCIFILETPSKLCQDNLKIFLKFLQVISLVHYYDSKFHLFDQETILCKLI